MRRKFDPDKGGFSRTGADKGRAVLIPDEIQSLLATNLESAPGYGLQRVLVRNNELRAAIRRCQAHVRGRHSNRAFEHPGRLNVGLQFLAWLDKCQFQFWNPGRDLDSRGDESPLGALFYTLDVLELWNQTLEPKGAWQRPP